MTLEQNNIANEAQTENIVKKIMTSEVKYLIGVLVFLFGVVAPYYQIKQDIALITQNHFTHIEAMNKNIEAMQTEIASIKETEVKLMTAIAENSIRLKNLEK